jgi:hypothetical protein
MPVASIHCTKAHAPMRAEIQVNKYLKQAPFYQTTGRHYS